MIGSIIAHSLDRESHDGTAILPAAAPSPHSPKCGPASPRNGATSPTGVSPFLIQREDGITVAEEASGSRSMRRSDGDATAMAAARARAEVKQLYPDGKLCCFPKDYEYRLPLALQLCLCPRSSREACESEGCDNYTVESCVCPTICCFCVQANRPPSHRALKRLRGEDGCMWMGCIPCACYDCEEALWTTQPRDPHATPLWRAKGGVKVFTGVVLKPGLLEGEDDVLVLLDDWNGELKSWNGALNGPGQVISTDEFSRMMLDYDADDRGPPPKFTHSEPGPPGESSGCWCCACPC